MIRVFLSSTALDLASERNAAADAINKLNGYTCVRMEDFGAISDIPLDACLAQLRECEIYLALIGHRYGSCPPGENLSYTEAEYQEAVRRKLPCLIFIMPDGALISAQNIESDPQRSKQTAFRDLVKAERVCAPFEDEHDLKFKIASSIANIRSSHAVDGPNARTVLMFPFVSSISGSDTAITIANTSALPDKPSMWMGGVVLYFFGWTPRNGCSVATRTRKLSQRATLLKRFDLIGQTSEGHHAGFAGTGTSTGLFNRSVPDSLISIGQRLERQ